MNTKLSNIPVVIFTISLWICANVQGQEPFPFHPQFHHEFATREQRLQHTGSLEVPAGSELYLGGPLNDQFSCEGLKYGYYADDSNDCHVYHICIPADETTHKVQRFSFLCGNQSLFNQKELVCDHASNVDCSQARNFYQVNDKFDEGLNYNQWWPGNGRQPFAAVPVAPAPPAPVAPQPAPAPLAPALHHGPLAAHQRFFPGHFPGHFPEHFPGNFPRFQG